jgi:hypothetical protein
MRALLFGLIFASMAGAAAAGPYGGYSSGGGTLFHDKGTLGPMRTPSAALPERQTWKPHRQPSQPSTTSGRPWKPYKPFSIYGDDPTSLAPSREPHYVPGYKPYEPPFRESNKPIF